MFDGVELGIDTDATVTNIMVIGWISIELVVCLCVCSVEWLPWENAHS
jgi:hypothetical protein